MKYKNGLEGTFIRLDTRDNKSVYRISNQYEKRKKNLKTDSETLKDLYMCFIFIILLIKVTFEVLFIDIFLGLIKFISKNIWKIICKCFKVSENIESEEIFNPRYMRIKEIEDYINSHYVDQEYIDKTKITNDLVIFKTYRDDLKIDTENDGKFPNLLSTFMTVYIAFLSLEIADKSNYFAELSRLKEKKVDNSVIAEMSEKIHQISGNILVIISIIILISLFTLLFSVIRTGKRSNTNRLKVVNNVIYILESIKENLVEVPDTKEYSIEVSNSEEGIEPSIYSIHVKEIL
ncbi:MAG: hypothetical protein E7H35_00235 [Peptoniphilus harei]|nr:hypothetical protein [Peptoniphilus harei]